MLYSLGNVGLLQANFQRVFARFLKQFAEVLDGWSRDLLQRDRILVGDNQKPGPWLQPQLFTYFFGNNDLPI